MERLTFAGIERKNHPKCQDYLEGVYYDREVIDPFDEEIVKDIIEIYQMYSHQLLLAGGEWAWIQENKQNEYKKNLAHGNKEALITMYQNFFRNQISFGISAPDSDSESTRRDLVNDTLLDLDTLREFCGDIPLSELNTPFIGNPFGVLIDSSLILYNSCRHYYHAHKIKELTENIKRPVILEIGGGYGGVFYYLNRLTKNYCYIVCDLAETLFTNYYFTKKWSHMFHKELKIKWVMEGEITPNDTIKNDLILVPSGNHRNIKCGFDVAYNSNSFSEMSFKDISDYFETIHQNQPTYIFHQNSNFKLWENSSRGHTEVLAKEFPIPNEYKLIYQAISPWSGAGGRYREYLYQHIN